MASGTELGKAYVQIIPSAQGISGAISGLLGGEVSTAGQSAGMALGGSLVGALTGVIATAGIGKLVTDAITTGMDFDKSMSQVAATMGTTVDQIGELRDFAKEMGATTAFSATQAADALNYMALAGYDAETSINMLPNVLNLAAAGGIELAQASDMVTDAQTALGLSLDETSVMVDQMAKASSKSNTSVAQLGNAFLTIGANARQARGGTAELSTVLGVLADNGIKGSEAGTHLRNIMLAMNPTTDKAVNAWNKLGVSAYDAEGNLRALPAVFEDLNKAMQGMTEQEKTDMFSAMFNKTDLASIQALVGTTSERFAELNTEIMNASGAAEQMANTQLGNLAGDITLAKSAFEGLQIAISEGVAPALREVVRGAGTFMQDLTASIASGDTDAIFNTITEGLSSAIQGAFDAIISGNNFLAEHADTIVTMGMDLISTLAMGIIQNVPTLVESAVNCALAFGNALISYDWTSLGAQLLMALQGLIPTESATNIMQPILDGITASLPGLLSTGVEIISNLATGILNALPSLLETAGTLVIQFADFVLSNLPTIIDAGIQLVINLATGIINALPKIVEVAQKLILEAAATLVKHMPEIFAVGVTIPAKLAAGIFQALPQIVSAAVKINTQIFDTITSFDWLGLGSDIINGIITGVKQMGDAFITAILSMCQGALGAVKQFFGISSPSKVMANEVGRYIPEGIALGIEQNADVVTDAMEDLKADTLSAADMMGISAKADFTNGASDNAAILARMDAMLSIMSRYFPEIAEQQKTMATSGDFSINAINRSLGTMMA